MTQIISLKASMTITCPQGKWIHESAWTPEHSAFAAKCPCFSGTSLHRLTWISYGGRDRPKPLGTGYFQAGRWIFARHPEAQRTEGSESMVAAASLQWEDGLFTSAWIFFSDTDGGTLTGEANPAFWLVEAIVQRLVPDMFVLHGSPWISSLREFGEMKVISIPNPAQTDFDKVTIVKLDREAWQNFPGSTMPHKDLDWIKRQVARENRQQQFASQTPKRPFLLRILLALSPMRRARSSKMVHPIDRLKRYLTS